MSNEDNYSNKDSNRNRFIEEKQRNYTNILMIIAVALIICLFGFYYFKKPPEIIPAKPEPPPIVSDHSHPYDSTRPPYSQ
jgi:hypothetical protein